MSTVRSEGQLSSGHLSHIAHLDEWQLANLYTYLEYVYTVTSQCCGLAVLLLM